MTKYFNLIHMASFGMYSFILAEVIPEDFQFEQSTLQAFYFFKAVEINDTKRMNSHAIFY